jgi:hypothetical protein
LVSLAKRPSNRSRSGIATFPLPFDIRATS